MKVAFWKALLLILTLGKGSVILAGNSVKSFTVTGNIVATTSMQLPSSIEVYRDDVKVDEVYVRKNGQFKLELDAGAYYTLVYSMPLHQSKKVIVSTEGGEAAVSKSIKVQVYMHAKNQRNQVPLNALDFPTSMIQFNRNTRSLEINEVYSAFVYGRTNLATMEESKTIVAQRSIMQP